MTKVNEYLITQSTIQDLNALRGLTPPADGTIMKVVGVGEYRYSTTSGANWADNGSTSATIIKPNSVLSTSNGRWFSTTASAVCPTFAALRGLLSGNQNHVHLQSHTTFGDGGGGIFDRVAIGSYVDDNGRVAIAGTYAWVRRRSIFDNVTPEQFGANTSADCTSIIQTCLAIGPTVVSAGNWRVDGTIQLGPNQSLKLMPGANLIRKATNSIATTPVVWINGADASLVGSDHSCVIKSENKSPSGVVRLGFTDMTGHVPDRSIYRCNIRNLKIEGMQNQGQSSGAPDVCLYMPSAQNDSDTFPRINYFHFIENLALSNSNHGIWFHGWTNGCFVSNIFGGGLRDTLIYLNGGLDNIIVGTFVDSSPTCSIIKLEDFTNIRGTYISQYNACSSINGEPGGALSSTISTGSTFTGSGNVFQTVVNTNQGCPVTANFYDSNTIINGSGLDTGYIRAHGISRFNSVYLADRFVTRADGTSFSPVGSWGYEHHWICSGLLENTTKSIAQLSIPDNIIQGGIVEIKGWTNGGNGINNAAYYGLWKIEKHTVGVAPVITALIPENNFVQPILTTSTALDFAVSVPNNGTSNNSNGYFEINIRGVTIADTNLWTFRSAASSVITGIVPGKKNVIVDLEKSSVGVTTLGSDGYTSIVPVVIPGLLPSTSYMCTLKYSVNIWKSSDITKCGTIDDEVNLYILTNSSSVATVTIMGTQVPDVSKLPAELLGATTTVTTITGGFTVNVSRPNTVACKTLGRVQIPHFDIIT